MPIEVFPGKTGDRLIYRQLEQDDAQTRDNSYALIHLNRLGTLVEIKATYQGGVSNGYPVLSPYMLSIDRRISRQIEIERGILVHNATVPVDDEESRALAEEYRAIVPVLSAIKVAKGLMVVLPQDFPTRRYKLGYVLDWEIFNT